MEKNDEKVLGETYESGKPTEAYNWRKKMQNPEQMLRYLQTAERYWSGQDGFGSERRRTPA
jgi:hypothetical protein